MLPLEGDDRLTAGQQKYMITCSCQVFSKKAARKLSKQWDVWRRFSEFDALYEYERHRLGHLDACVACCHL